jgi:hypothetical protein
MKAEHMSVKYDGFTFKNGESHLVVYDGHDDMVDIVEWPSPRARSRPRNMSAMEFAANAWFEQRHDETVKDMAARGKSHVCTKDLPPPHHRGQPYRNGNEAQMVRDMTRAQHVEIEISPNGRTVFIRVGRTSLLRITPIGNLIIKDRRRLGVHIAHCCAKHGCKYGDNDCPVATGRARQQSLCDHGCDDDLVIKDRHVLDPDTLIGHRMAVHLDKDNHVIDHYFTD